MHTFFSLIVIIVSDVIILIDYIDLIAPSSTLQLTGEPALLSVLGAHLLFNMKEAGEKGLNQGTSYGPKSTVSNIDFVAPTLATSNESQSEESEPDILGSREIC